MAHVLILGGTTFDHIITLDKFPDPSPQTIHQAPFYETVGSTGSGKAICLKKLGVSNTLYSVFGNDDFGQRIQNKMRQEQIDFIFDLDSKGTERHVNIMDKSGGRISMFVSQSSESPTTVSYTHLTLPTTPYV